MCSCYMPRFLLHARTLLRGSACSPSLSLPCDVQVPKDAWSMDMVFSDSGDLQAAFYDNNSGVDYHVPVTGSSASPPRLRITHVSVEMAPIAKV